MTNTQQLISHSPLHCKGGQKWIFPPLGKGALGGVTHGGFVQGIGSRQSRFNDPPLTNTTRVGTPPTPPCLGGEKGDADLRSDDAGC